MTKLITGAVSTPNINRMDGYSSLSAIFSSAWEVGGIRLEITVLWWIIFVILAAWILQRTKIGNWIFAVGGNADSACAVVPVRKVKIGLFMTVAFTCWFVGMHLLYKFNTLQAGLGVGNEFLYIIAAVVGGTLLTGGFGNAFGVALGAFIFGMTNLGIVYAGWDPNWFRSFLGVMLLLAVMVNMYIKKLSTTRKVGQVMTDTLQEHADPTLHKGEPLVEMIDVGKTYGAIRASDQPDRQCRRGDLRARRQWSGQVDIDQDHFWLAPAQRGHAQGRRHRTALFLTT